MTTQRLLSLVVVSVIFGLGLAVADAATGKLPTAPNPSGIYMMFEDSPYAHLMGYRDPRKMK
ncbi:MAG: hypothetical protein U0412_05795 [Nitrospira sp.]